MPVSNWTPFRIGAEKFAKAIIDLDSHTFKLALTGSAQALSETFTGASTDCRYSDLTAELPTAGGYTIGGVTLSGLLVSRVANLITWSSSNASWSLSSSLVFKYAVIYDDSNANKDLICFSDMDTGGGTVTASISPLTFSLTPGILRLTAV